MAPSLRIVCQVCLRLEVARASWQAASTAGSTFLHTQPLPQVGEETGVDAGPARRRRAPHLTSTPRFELLKARWGCILDSIFHRSVCKGPNQATPAY